MDGGAIEKQDKFEPFRTHWALQADVVGALIKVLEGPEPTIDKVTEAIQANEVVGTSAYEVRLTMWDFIRRRYDENLNSPKLLEDLRKQKEFLKIHNNVPPFKYFMRIHASVREEIEKKYGPKTQE